MKPFLALAAASVACSTNSLALTERDLGKHVHGVASLNVAVADSAVFIELYTPWNNLVGFEHAPRTDEQHAMVDEALQQLDDPTEIFVFNGGDCSVDEIVLESGMSDDSHASGDEEGDHDDEHADDHDDDDEHDAGHDEEHAGEHDEEHDDEHDEEHAGEHGDEHEDEHDSSTHTSLLASYSFTCNQPDELQSIDLVLFSIWPGTKELDVQLISDKGQTLVELGPDQSVLNLDAMQ